MTALIAATPVAFAADGTVDLEASERVFAFAAASGIDAAFVLGTTGEFAALDPRERSRLSAVAVEVLGAQRTVVHVGAAAAHGCIEGIRAARAAGAATIAVLTPYYLPVSDAALRAFYTDVLAAADGLDAYVYLFRERTGVTPSLDVLAEIFRMPGVIGAKVSGESLDTVKSFAQISPASFRTLTGADTDLGRVGGYGLDGVVSGLSSAVPEPFVELRAAVDAGDEAAASAAQARVNDVARVLRGDIRRLKTALVVRGVLPRDTCRMALDDDVDRAEIEEMLARVL